MKKVFTLLLLVMLPSLASAQPKQNPQSKPVVFTHVTVIDATGAPAKPDMTLVIVGDRIAELGPTKRVRMPKDALVVNTTSKFLIPGLWDMHVHIFNQVSRRPPNAWYFPLFVANGVTGVREMWTKPQDVSQVFEWRRQFGKGTFTLPRIAAVGTVVDGQPSKWPNTDTVATPDEARRMVRKIKGVDFVKTYSNLSREAYSRLSMKPANKTSRWPGTCRSRWGRMRLRMPVREAWSTSTKFWKPAQARSRSCYEFRSRIGAAHMTS